MQCRSHKAVPKLRFIGLCDRGTLRHVRLCLTTPQHKYYINLFDTVPLRGLLEKPALQDAPSNLAVLGRYILSPKIFDLLEGIRPGVGGEIQLTDALSELLGHVGLNTLKTDADVYDCGNKLGYLNANLAVGMLDAVSRASLYALFNKLIDDDF